MAEEEAGTGGTATPGGDGGEDPAGAGGGETLTAEQQVVADAEAAEATKVAHQEAIDKAVLKANQANAKKYDSIISRAKARETKMLSALKEKEVDTSELETEGKVDKMVQDHLKSHGDLDNLVKKYPGLQEHRDAVMEAARHESRANIPIETIAMEVVGLDNLLAMGASKAVIAEKAAADSKVGGGTPAKVTAKKDWSKATPEEMEVEKHRIAVAAA